MNTYEIAEYAALLPEDERDRFATFANHKAADQVRGFIRYQLQMRHMGYKPKATPGPWYRKGTPQ